MRYIISCLVALLAASPFSAYADDSSPVEEFKPHVELTYFEPSNSNIIGSLGVIYEVAYNIKLNDPLAASTKKPGFIVGLNYYSFNLFSKGSVPFKKDFLIANFMETGLDAGWEFCKLGTLQDYTDDSQDKQAAKFLIKLSANGQYETDSGFNQKQVAYGMKSRVVFKPGTDSIVRYFNPLEWMPSLVKVTIKGMATDNAKIRAAKPFDEPYWPSVAIAVEQVAPKDDDKRKLIDPALDKYERARLDLSYSSTLFKVKDDIFRVSFTWRYFQEISPSKEIKNAGLDKFSYWTVAVHTPKEIVISYSRGQLPFDVQSEKIFKLGWNYNFY
jgi:hypothetical protein